MSAIHRRTKILATLGPASDGALKMEELLRAGVDLFRLNFSHGDHAGHAARIAAAREAEKSVGRPIALLADLQGPKLRIGDIAGGQIDVRMSSELRLRAAATSNDPDIIPIPHPELVASL
ncbi:MAG: pyruvate kinase, partial [Hyphomonadaceae bacterium]